MSREIILEALNGIRDEYVTEAGVRLGLVTAGAAAVGAVGAAADGAADGAGLYSLSSAGTAAKVGFGAWLAKGGWIALAAGVLVAAGVAVGAFFLGNSGDTPPAGVETTAEEQTADTSVSEETEDVTQDTIHDETQNGMSGELETETETEIPSHVHTYGEWQTVTEPTCAEKGKRERSCDCGDIQTENIATLPHTTVVDPAVPPTVTESGFTAGAHCEVCGKVLAPRSVVAATGHTDLAFEINEDGRTCTITGIGTCTATEIYIPSSMEGYKVTRIGEIAFISQPITAVHIPSSVTEICDGAFHGCTQLTEITLPSTVTALGFQVFQSCTGLTAATIQCSLPELPVMTFEGCTSLSTVNLPNGLSTIGMSAFANCESLREITFPSSIQGIGVQAFLGCTALTDVAIPSRLSVLDDEAFSGCVGLEGEIVLPDGMVRIGSSAFAGCSGITSVTVPKGVKQAEPNAFAGMDGLTDIHFRGTEAQWNAVGYTVGDNVQIHFGA